MYVYVDMHVCMCVCMYVRICMYICVSGLTLLSPPRYTVPLAKDPNAALRRGYALAIGALPAFQLKQSLELAVTALIAASVQVYIYIYI